MDLLSQNFNAITFQAIVDFCGQRIVESTVLDYKEQMPRDLAKHIAAMSNRYGGLIIIGVKEDRETGVPARSDGIANDSKLIERIHQIANNVRPLPGYAVRVTNEIAGKVFLLLKVYEGDAPPYTTINDPTVYLRTGNVTTPLRQADTDIVHELYAKREGAQAVRQQSLGRAKTTLQAVVESKTFQVKLPAGSSSPNAEKIQEVRLSDRLRLHIAYIQPFFPLRELSLPRTMRSKLADLQLRSNNLRSFPNHNARPITRGMLSFDWTGKDFHFSSDQIYANGLFYHVENIYRPHLGNTDDIYVSDIARVLYCTLLFGGKLYNEVGYSGLVGGGVNLEGTRGRRVKTIRNDQARFVFAEEEPEALDEWYSWQIEADTHQLSDAQWVREYMYTRMREICWDLGIEDLNKDLLYACLDAMAFS